MAPRITNLAAVTQNDLSVIREELESAAEVLGRALGFPVAYLGADQKSVAYVAPGGMVTASYKIDENDIEFDHIDFSENPENENRRDRVALLVRAIESDDSSMAETIFEGLMSDNIRLAEARDAVSARINEAKLRAQATGINEETMPVVPASRPASPYFTAESFPALANISDVRNQITALIDGCASDDDLAEAFRFKSVAGKIKKVRISKKARRIAKKVARKNRAALVMNLRKARKALRSKKRKSSFRRRVQRVRALNASVDMQGLQQQLIEIVAKDPRIAYMPVREMEDIVRECMVESTTDKPEKIVVEETAEALVRLARELVPESRRHIVEAAALYVKPSDEVGQGNDIDDAIECCASRIYEAVDKEEGDKSGAVKALKKVVDELVARMSDDIEDEEESDEVSEIKSVLDKLTGFQTILVGYIDAPESIDLGKLGSMVNDITVTFGLDDDKDEEGAEDEDSEDDEDAEDEDGDSSEDNTEDEDDEDEDEEEDVKKPSKKKKAKKDEGEETEDDEDEEEAEDSAFQNAMGESLAKESLVEMLRTLKAREDEEDNEQNEWNYKGRTYRTVIHEINEENGSIIGEVESDEGPEGSFEIRANGQIMRFPTADLKHLTSVYEACKMRKQKRGGEEKPPFVQANREEQPL